MKCRRHKLLLTSEKYVKINIAEYVVVILKDLSSIDLYHKCVVENKFRCLQDKIKLLKGRS